MESSATNNSKAAFTFEVIKLAILAAGILFVFFQPGACNRDQAPAPDTIRKTIIINDTILQHIEKVDTIHRSSPYFHSIFVGRGADSSRVTTIIKGPCIPDTVTTTVNDTIIIIQEAPPKLTTNHNSRLMAYFAATGGASFLAPGLTLSYKRVTAGVFYYPQTPSAPLLFTLGYKLQFGKVK